MPSQHELPQVLLELVEDERLDPMDPESITKRAALYMRNSQELMLTKHGLELLQELIDAFYADPIVKENLDRTQVTDQVIDMTMKAAHAHDAKQLEAPSLIADLVTELHAGLEDWHFLVLVFGLQIRCDRTMAIAGMTLGPLSNNERMEQLARADRIGRSAFFVDNPEPGSAYQHIMEEHTEFLEGDNCWARGTIRCHEDALDRLVKERLNIVALNVLRCFAALLQRDPDRLSLGEPNPGVANKILHYKVTPEGNVDRFDWGYSRYGDRLPFVLGMPDIEYLQGLESFNQVRDLVEKWIEIPDSVNPLENKLLLGILQFGTASALDPLEVKLQNYLTVLETLYGRDRADDNEGFKQPGRRASLMLEANDRENFRDEVRRLYAVRRLPVHYGARNLRGHDVVTPGDVRSAQRVALESILYALKRAPEFVDDQSHEGFLDALDNELSPILEGKQKCLFVMWHDRATASFRALAPDYPEIVGTGPTSASAYRDARDRVEEEIARLTRMKQPLPARTATIREPELKY